MISDAKLAGHSCGQGQIESRTMLLALEEKRTKLWMMFKRGIVRLEEEQKKKEKNGVCTSRKKHRCRTKKRRSQKVRTAPETKVFRGYV